MILVGGLASIMKEAIARGRLPETRLAHTTRVTAPDHPFVMLGWVPAPSQLLLILGC